MTSVIYFKEIKDEIIHKENYYNYSIMILCKNKPNIFTRIIWLKLGRFQINEYSYDIIHNKIV